MPKEKKLKQRLEKLTDESKRTKKSFDKNKNLSEAFSLWSEKLSKIPAEKITNGQWQLYLCSATEAYTNPHYPGQKITLNANVLGSLKQFVDSPESFLRRYLNANPIFLGSSDECSELIPPIWSMNVFGRIGVSFIIINKNDTGVREHFHFRIDILSNERKNLPDKISHDRYDWNLTNHLDWQQEEIEHYFNDAYEEFRRWERIRANFDVIYSEFGDAK